MASPKLRFRVAHDHPFQPLILERRQRRADLGRD
jgi:hypothetical protein